MVRKKAPAKIKVVNQAELFSRVQATATKAGFELPANVVNILVRIYHQEIASALANGEKVKIVGFGNFEVKDRAARTGRNPRTGQEIKIPARKVPAFTAGLNLRTVVNPANQTSAKRQSKKTNS